MYIQKKLKYWNICIVHISILFKAHSVTISIMSDVSFLVSACVCVLHVYFPVPQELVDGSASGSVHIRLTEHVVFCMRFVTFRITIKTLFSLHFTMDVLTVCVITRQCFTKSKLVLNIRHIVLTRSA
jgi:hypothetical protein